MTYPLVLKIWPLPRIKSIPETIQKIIEDHCSIVRFGDSEFLFLTQKLDLPYQEYDQKLAEKLLLILKNSKPN
ncbi:MAG: GT-D fold domain-containing glycosyltransferase, partial [Cyclobacteriaceae bacterium]|nr:GT-D fold domain-containing glycosyltransferase [Cyclobacteriaceae bacterium]